MTHTLSIEYDDAVLLSTGLPEQEFNAEARFLLAAKLYEMGRLSSGQSSRLCGMSRVAFLTSLPRVGIPISNIRSEDVKLDIEAFRNG
ncbi:MAG TPA: UPF0175 family protein [Candidatus Hydrogenedentes bacterium]|nr:UPF0175 family protein [Candidatus Hydrogenedentota bacterium]